jgi:hypothetical protein
MSADVLPQVRVSLTVTGTALGVEGRAHAVAIFAQLSVGRRPASIGILPMTSCREWTTFDWVCPRPRV